MGRTKEHTPASRQQHETETRHVTKEVEQAATAVQVNLENAQNRQF